MHILSTQKLLPAEDKKALQNGATDCSNFDLYQVILGVTEVGALE